MNTSVGVNAIRKAQDDLIALAMKMWNEPELAFLEYKAAEWSAELLEKYGFRVERGCAGVPTAVRAEWGSGKPVIGIFGELDALAKMSQKVSTAKEAVEENASGHACGHNLMNAAAIGGAIGLKAELEQRGLGGTVVYYGCPAEEIVTGKALMAKGGAFTELSAAIAFHPGNLTYIQMGPCKAVKEVEFHFQGVASQAAKFPEHGRSALDAVELMDIATNYLREHVPQDVRIAYIITDGGEQPGTVPARASVKYNVGALSRDTVDSTFARVLNNARGASIMTDTSFTVEDIGGCYETMPNRVLADVVHEAQLEAEAPVYTEEEEAFAGELNRQSIPYAAMVRARSIPEGQQLFSAEPKMNHTPQYFSNDFADVEHIVPGVQFHAACWNLGAVAHSWQAAACSAHSIGMKGMLYAADVMCIAGRRLVENPAQIDAAKAEFDAAMAGKSYVCPVPENFVLPQR